MSGFSDATRAFNLAASTPKPEPLAASCCLRIFKTRSASSRQASAEGMERQLGCQGFAMYDCMLLNLTPSEGLNQCVAGGSGF